MEEAIALTWSTMTARLKNLRFGALASLATAVILIVLTLILRSGWVLAGLPVLLLLGTFFVYREQKIIFAWEDRVLALWGTSNLCLGILAQTMNNHPHTLKQSLKSLVAPLPENADFLVPPIDRIKVYRWLFWTRSLAQEIRFGRAAAFNIILSCLPVCIWAVSASGWPWILLGVSPICALPMAETVLTRLAVWRWEKRGKGLGEWSADALKDFQARMDAMDWSRVPAGVKEAVRARPSKEALANRG